MNLAFFTLKTLDLVIKINDSIENEFTKITMDDLDKQNTTTTSFSISLSLPLFASFCIDFIKRIHIDSSYSCLKEELSIEDLIKKIISLNLFSRDARIKLANVLKNVDTDLYYAYHMDLSLDEDQKELLVYGFFNRELPVINVPVALQHLIKTRFIGSHSEAKKTIGNVLK